MSSPSSAVAILLADITGSTPLFERIGDEAAARQIAACIESLRDIVARTGGDYIVSRGDDVLCTFADPFSAFLAAREMQMRPFGAGLAIHAGMHFGPIVFGPGSILGDSVNLTARLAALARPGEVLISRSLVDQLPLSARAGLSFFDAVALKGKSVETDVYSLPPGNVAAHTRMLPDHSLRQARAGSRSPLELTITLRYESCSQTCNGGASLWIGRSADCNIVVDRSWVSRQHALIKVGGGKVHLEDRSSGGTYVSMASGYEFFVSRETVLLTGSGMLSPAMRPTAAGAAIIHYEIVSTATS
jgi:adenylate cyclase